MILLMVAGQVISSTSSLEGERVEKEGMPISMVLRRSSETEMEGPITVRFSELDPDEGDVFSEAKIVDGMAVGFVKVERTESAISIKDLYLLPELNKLGVGEFVPLVLRQHYPGKTVTLMAPIRTS